MEKQMYLDQRINRETVNSVVVRKKKIITENIFQRSTYIWIERGWTFGNPEWEEIAVYVQLIRVDLLTSYKGTTQIWNKFKKKEKEQSNEVNNFSANLRQEFKHLEFRNRTNKSRRLSITTWVIYLVSQGDYEDTGERRRKSLHTCTVNRTKIVLLKL